MLYILHVGPFTLLYWVFHESKHFSLGIRPIGKIYCVINTVLLILFY